MKLMVLACLAVAAIPCSAVASVDDAIVMIGGCSGVCVDPSGIVLTAKHCELPADVTVRFKQRTVKAIRVYSSNDSEGPVAYDCEGDGYPALPVASTAPAIGEKLWSFGYPTLTGRRELRQAYGSLLRWGTFKFAGGEFNGNVLGFACAPGWSGGPLLNAKSEVCGLLNSSDDRTSVFISSAAVRQASAAAKSARQQRPSDSEPQLPELMVFGTATCSPCVQFKSDLQTNPAFAAKLQSAFELVWIDTIQRPEMVVRYGIEQVPVFLTSNGVRVVGYTTAEELLLDLGLRAKPDPRPPPENLPAPEIGTTPPTTPMPIPTEPGLESPTPQPTPATPAQPTTDAVDRLTSLTQQAITFAAWLGITGVSGGTAGAVLGGLALWRTLRRRGRRQSSIPPLVHSTHPTTITHDSKPLPQQIVPETRFAAYERDSHAEAFAWASAEMVRKYPGAVGTLESLQGLINQYLASRGLRKPPNFDVR